MEQSILKQAAEKHCAIARSPVGTILYIHKVSAFEAGAKWQKEQDKEIINALKELVECDYTSGTLLSCALIRGKNALRSINEPFQD
jgi:hypothetical protein